MASSSLIAARLELRPTSVLSEHQKFQKHKGRRQPGFDHLLFDWLYCFLLRDGKSS